MSERGHGIDRLLAVMRRLRDPERGCPWDVEQSFATIAPYTIEEAYEVADAILREDWDALPGELGDLLLQVVYHARMGEERGWFDFDQVADGIAAKMVERHPHVFGAEEVEGSRARTVWEDRKARERAARAERRGGDASLLADVPLGLPALTRAVKLQAGGARRVRLDRRRPVLAKLREELAELEAALAGGAALAESELELGDLLFTVANFAAPGTRPRGGLAGHQRQVRAALPADRGRGRRVGRSAR